MIGFFRSMFQSRIGLIVTLGFVALIALAFASSDITGTGFGGVAGGDRAATVGEATIGTAALNQSVGNAFNRAREEDPTLTMQRFTAQGAVDQVLDSMIDRFAIAEFGRAHGLVASDALVGSEIVKILNTAEMKERLAVQGAEVLTNTPEQFSAFIRDEKSRWGQVVKAANLKLE